MLTRLNTFLQIGSWILAFVAAATGGVGWYLARRPRGPRISRLSNILQVTGFVLAALAATSGGIGWYVANRLTAPRTISAVQEATFLGALAYAPKGVVQLQHLGGDLESERLANRLTFLLKRAGWTVTRTALISAEVPVGIILTVHSAEKAPPHAAPLQNALEAIGLPAPGMTNSQLTEGTLVLIVGQKP